MLSAENIQQKNPDSFWKFKIFTVMESKNGWRKKNQTIFPYIFSEFFVNFWFFFFFFSFILPLMTHTHSTIWKKISFCPKGQATTKNDSLLVFAPIIYLPAYLPIVSLLFCPKIIMIIYFLVVTKNIIKNGMFGMFFEIFFPGSNQSWFVFFLFLFILLCYLVRINGQEKYL